MFQCRNRRSNPFDPSCFLLEPLEPRRLLDATIFQDIGVDLDHLDAAPIIDGPAKVIRTQSQHYDRYAEVFSDLYNVQFHASQVYDLRVDDPLAKVNVRCHGTSGWNPPQYNIMVYPSAGDALCQVYVNTPNPDGYVLTISSAAHDVADGLFHAIPVAPGITADVFSAPAQIHYFKFHAINDSRFTFKTILTALSQANLRLLAADGTELMDDNHRWSNAPDSVLQWRAPATGVYYLEVVGFDAGSYQLTMTEELDDQAGEAPPLPADGIATGRHDHPNDADAFTFHASPGTIYSFRSADDSTDQPPLSIRNEAGQSVVSRTIPHRQMDRWINSFPSILWTPAKEGTYTLGIWDDSVYDGAAPADYKIVMEAIPVPPPDSSAPLIAPGEIALQPSSLATPHLFQFHARRNAAYTFSRDPFSTWFDPIIQVLAADGTVLADSNTGLRTSITWFSAAEATVYLRVTSTANYADVVQMSEHIDDQDGKPADVTLPAQLNGSIDFNVRGTASDEDFFRFHAVAGTTYVLVNNDEGWANLELLDENFSPVPDALEYFDVSDRWTAPATGTYYLKVFGAQYRRYGFTGPYSFSLFEAPLEEQSSKPLPMELGSTLTGVFYYPADYRTFTLNIPAGDRYRLVMSMPAWGYLNLTHLKTNYSYDAPAYEDGMISRSFTLEPGQYEVYIEAPSAGPFLLLADLASNFKIDPATDDDEQSDEDEQFAEDEEEGDFGDEEILFDHALDNVDSDDVGDWSWDDGGDWLDDSEDTLDSFDDELW